MEPPRRRWLVASLVLAACEGAAAPEGFRVTLYPGGRLRVESARVALSDIDVVLRLGGGSERALSALSPRSPCCAGTPPTRGGRGSRWARCRAGPSATATTMADGTSAVTVPPHAVRVLRSARSYCLSSRGVPTFFTAAPALC
jgi:hypothetical protein